MQPKTILICTFAKTTIPTNIEKKGINKILLIPNLNTNSTF